MKSKPDRVETYARLLTKMAGGGAVSPKLAELEPDIERRPRLCLDALAQFARLPGGPEHELAAGYIALINTWLTTLRLMADSGSSQASDAIAEFQQRLAALGDRADCNADAFLALTVMLGHAGIVATPAVEAAMTRLADDFADETAGAPGGIGAVLDELAPMAGEDPFALVEMLMETGHAMPVVAKAAMAAELAGRTDTSAAGLLLLLHPADEVRRAVIRSLTDIAGQLDGVALRRLIAVRNWIPDGERGALDALIRAVRVAGIECASWPDSHIEEINATSIDGSGAQSFMIVTRTGRRRTLSCILAKRGVRDAWTARQTKAEITATLSMARRESGLAAVSRRYLDCAVRHQLQLGLAAGIPPSVGLLDIAESIGAADWLPDRFDWRAGLHELSEALPAAVAEPERRRKILEESEFWSLHDALQPSWFEEGPHVTRVLARRKRQDRSGATDHILSTVLEPARDKWAEHFAWVAFRLCECPKPPASWKEFTVLAAALADGTALSDIPVMRSIAARSVEAAWTR